MLAILEKFKVYVFAFLVMALVVVIAGAAFEINSLQGKVSKLEEANVTLRTRNVTLEGANKQMATDIRAQNLALEAMKRSQEAKTEAAEKALADAVAERNRWRDRYAVLFGDAPASKDDCTNVATLVNNYFSLRKEEAGK